jgi:hypothetical protein
MTLDEATQAIEDEGLSVGRVQGPDGGRVFLTWPLEGSEVEGTGQYAAGEWSAVFVRPLRSSGGVSFAEGSYVPVAFSVWDGTARERGNKRALTQWVYVYLQPREKPSAVGPMLASALAVLGLELLVVGAIRRRQRAAVPVPPPSA